MTMHFGHKIVIGFCAFATLMVVLVYKSFQTDFELVSKNYYQEELVYQDVIDATKNSQQLSNPVLLDQSKARMRVSLPTEMSGKEISGAVYFYCPANGKNDRSFPLQSSVLEIPMEKIPKAGYVVKTSWTADGKSYHQEQNIIIE